MYIIVYTENYVSFLLLLLLTRVTWYFEMKKFFANYKSRLN